MPQILLVKTSSLGDVVHNLPVVNDILAHVPGAGIDWVIEESLQALPTLHPGVRSAIAAAPRRWRRAFWTAEVRREWREFRQRLRAVDYDLVLDTQGLVKSAFIARLARGRRCGLDFASAREPLALFYDQTFSVPWSLHAVERNRSLAAQALGYRPAEDFDYGLRAQPARFEWLPAGAYAVLLHVTSDARKLWPEPLWVQLGQRLDAAGMAAVLPWGTDEERARSERLAHSLARGCVPPRLTLAQAAGLLAGAQAVIGVDTGLTHLAAALAVPAVGIYATTDPAATGLYARRHATNVGGIGRQPGLDEVLAALEKVRAE